MISEKAAEARAANPAHQDASARLDFWWRLMDRRVGIVPVPVYVLLLALVGAFVLSGEVATDISTMIGVLALGGFACAEIGRRIPALRNIGGPAIVSAFLPSFLVYQRLMPEPVVRSVTDFTRSTNFIYLFIASIVVGSILSMDRAVLIRGFLKIFVPLAVGSVAAAAAGVAVGWMLGVGARESFFFIVVPIMAGGVGEGAIPLSTGYAEILGETQGALFARILPVALFGNLIAVFLSGWLNSLGRRLPRLTGNGRLDPGGEGAGGKDAGASVGSQSKEQAPVDLAALSAAGMTAISLYLAGVAIHRAAQLPAPITMLFLAVLLKVTRAFPPRLEEGARHLYRFFVSAVTYPLMFAISVSSTPWNELVAAFHPANLAVMIATVATLVGAGFLVGRWVGMYPVETAIVNACHSGLGGTGDIMILTAANRMELLPFAQIATRIGGAITVTLALIALARFA